MWTEESHQTHTTVSKKARVQKDLTPFKDRHNDIFVMSEIFYTF